MVINLSFSIQQSLKEFEDIFQLPTTLPPFRPGFDHTILLLQGVDPVNIRPYRCSKSQKDIIDRLVQDYLQSGVIQHSNSLYTSLVVLVGKKDGT